MFEITNLFGENLTEKQQAAARLHLDIVKAGENAALALVDFAKNLKRMRDEALYTEFGFGDFGYYVEQAVGIKQRQAYNYITVVENLPESVLQSNAKLGVTKLQILAAMPAAERDEMLNSENVEKISVKEMEALKKKYTEQTEQLTIALEKAEDSADEIEELQKDLEFATVKLNAAEAKLREAEERPEAVAVREPTEEEIAAATEERVKAAVAAAKAEHDEEIKQLKKDAADKKKKAEEKAKADAEKAAADEVAAAKAEAEQAKKALAELIEQNKRAELKSAELEKSAKVNGDPNIQKFKFYFEQVQTYISELKRIAGAVEPEQREKLKAAMKAVADMLTAEG